MAEVGSRQNCVDQNYRRLYGDNQFDEKRSRALHVCIILYRPTQLNTFFLLSALSAMFRPCVLNSYFLFNADFLSKVYTDCHAALGYLDQGYDCH